MDPLFVIGIVANLAGVVTFVDWAMVKSKAKKRGQEAAQSLNALGKLETNLEEIENAIKGNRDNLEIKKYVDAICEAKSDLIRELRDMGIRIPREDASAVRGVSDTALLTLVSVCRNSVSAAKRELE